MTFIFNRVKPGDLITADLMNSALDALENLDTRVARLETGTSAGSAVQITSVIPAGGIGAPIRVNDELQILGLNFGYSRGAQRVFFDSGRVDEYRVGSSDTRLIVPVPSLPDLPEAGRLVVLRVENGTLFDTKNITVLPILQTLTGDIDVIWLDVPENPDPNPITPNQSATFAYQLRSRANLTAVCTITPSVTIMSGAVPAGLANPQVLDASRNNITSRQISLNPGQTRAFFIHIPTVPSGTNGLEFNLNVSASAGSLSGSDQRPFIIGTPVEPSDPTIQLTFSSFNPVAQFNDTTNEISLRQGVIGTMNYQAIFTEAGTYHVTFELSAATSNWEVGPGNTPLLNPGETTPVYGYIETTPNVTENAQFKVRAKSGASATGQVIFTIMRDGQTIGQTRRYNLVLLP